MAEAALSPKDAVEQELYNIFTFYTLHGDARDPERLKATQFKNFASDIRVLAPGSHVRRADLDVLFRRILAEAKAAEQDAAAPGPEGSASAAATASSSSSSSSSASSPATARRPAGFGSFGGRPAKAGGAFRRSLTFPDFMNALMHLSVRFLPRAASLGAAFQQLLVTRVLPLASRRAPEAVDGHLADRAVVGLFGYYEGGLRQVFEFYVQISTLRRLAEAGRSRGRHGSLSHGGLSTRRGSDGSGVGGGAGSRRGAGAADGRSMGTSSRLADGGFFGGGTAYERYGGGGAAAGAAGMAGAEQAWRALQAEEASGEADEAGGLLYFPEALRLAADFEFDALLSSIDFADAFLSAVSLRQQQRRRETQQLAMAGGGHRGHALGVTAAAAAAAAAGIDQSHLGLSFGSFWELLVRCALMAYGEAGKQQQQQQQQQQQAQTQQPRLQQPGGRRASIGMGGHVAAPAAGPSACIAGLFLHMWRSVDEGGARHSGSGNGALQNRGLTAHREAMVAGTAVFRRRFRSRWVAEDCVDYVGSAKGRGSEEWLSAMGRRGVRMAERHASESHHRGGYVSPRHGAPPPPPPPPPPPLPLQVGAADAGSGYGLPVAASPARSPQQGHSLAAELDAVRDGTLAPPPLLVGLGGARGARAATGADNTSVALQQLVRSQPGVRAMLLEGLADS
jgi:hypothetical protein